VCFMNGLRFLLLSCLVGWFLKGFCDSIGVVLVLISLLVYGRFFSVRVAMMRCSRFVCFRLWVWWSMERNGVIFDLLLM